MGLFGQSFRAVEIVCSMENPTVEAVVQKILDTEPAYEEVLRQKQSDLCSRYASVKNAMDEAQVNGRVSKALKESRDKKLRDFIEENKPFINSDDLVSAMHRLLGMDPRMKQYESEEKRLQSEADSIELTRMPRLNLMNLHEGNVDYTLEKIYSQEQGTTSFEGRVKLRYPDRDGMECLVVRRYISVEASILQALLTALTEEGLHAVNKSGSLVIDNVATLSLDFSHHDGSGRYSDRINYRSDLGQLDANSLRGELMRAQKVFQVVYQLTPKISL